MALGDISAGDRVVLSADFRLSSKRNRVCEVLHVSATGCSIRELQTRKGDVPFQDWVREHQFRRPTDDELQQLALERM